MMSAMLVLALNILGVDLSKPPFSDAKIKTALIAHGQTHLLYLAAAADQGTDGMTMGFDTWWHLCEGRWTKDVQVFLPRITDAQLRAFLKRYAKQHRQTSPRSLLGHDEFAMTLMPGETKSIPVKIWHK